MIALAVIAGVLGYTVVAGATYQRLYPGPYVGEPAPDPKPEPVTVGMDDRTAYLLHYGWAHEQATREMDHRFGEMARECQWKRDCRRARVLAVLWLPSAVAYGAWAALRAAYRFGRRVA